MGNQKKTPQARLLTCCGVCRRAITPATPVVWQRAPVTGLVHTECATDPDATPVDLSRACGSRLGGGL